MRGLLLKDLYTLIKQMKLMLVMLLVFACIPGYSVTSFAMVYASMLPITALAYDERSKWDEMAAMLPYPVRSIVLSKYLLGLICIAVSLAVSFTAQCVAGLIRGERFEPENAVALLLVGCLSLLLLIINLPLMFRFGVEKGRIAFMLLLCGTVIAGISLGDKLAAALENAKSLVLPTAGVLLVTVVLLVISVSVSVKCWQKKR